MTGITHDQMLNRLSEFVVECGSQKEAAKKLKVSPGYFNDMIHGNRAISEGVGRYFGFQRRVIFEQVWESDQ